MRNLISIVDDDKFLLQFLGKVLKSDSTDIQLYHSPKEFLKNIGSNEPDIIISDLLMPEISGMDIVKSLRDSHPLLPFIMLTTEAKIETAVQAMKEGADDYIVKPVDVDEFRLRVHKALESGKLRKKSQKLLDEKKQYYRIEALAGESKFVRKMREFCFVSSSSAIPLWLVGNKGVGKSFIANLLHYNSFLSDSDLILLNCSSDSLNTLETVLTKISCQEPTESQTNSGKLKRSNGETLIIKNPELLSVELQDKLADKINILGEIKQTDAHSSRTQIICISNSPDAKSLSENSKLCEKLCQCLNKYSLLVPSLAERLEDVPALAEFYLNKNRKPPDISIILTKDAIEKLVNYAWHNELIEFFNTLDRAIFFAKNNEISAKEISMGNAFESASSSNIFFPIPQGLPLKDIQGEYVRQTIEYFENDLSKIADSLKVSRKTLWEIRKKHALP